MGAAMSRQADAETVMIITMMYEELISLDVNSVGGASPVTQANVPRHPICYSCNMIMCLHVSFNIRQYFLFIPCLIFLSLSSPPLSLSLYLFSFFLPPPPPSPSFLIFTTIDPLRNSKYPSNDFFLFSFFFAEAIIKTLVK